MIIWGRKNKFKGSFLKKEEKISFIANKIKKDLRKMFH